MKYWTDPWNPIVGCEAISPGCDNCYAVACASQRRMKKYERVYHNGAWTGDLHLDRKTLEAPLHARKPRVYFNSMCDPFHKLVEYDWQGEIFEVIKLCQHHTFVICSKRAELMCEFLLYLACMIPHKYTNVYLGVTVENQQCADERLLHLAKLAAAGWNTWISYEPALSVIDWERVFAIDCSAIGRAKHQCELANFNGIIAGGESGPNARPSHPDWFRSCRDACADAGISFTFKQIGSNTQFFRDEKHEVRQVNGMQPLDGVYHWHLPWEDKK